MNSYNYSYNVLINRLEAFAAGHFLIKRFTHGQIDMSDQLQDDQYPFMHVTPDTIEPISGGMHFGFHIRRSETGVYVHLGQWNEPGNSHANALTRSNSFRVLPVPAGPSTNTRGSRDVNAGRGGYSDPYKSQI